MLLREKFIFLIFILCKISVQQQKDLYTFKLFFFLFAECLLHFPSVPLPVLLWLLTTGVHSQNLNTIKTTRTKILTQLSFPNPSRCMTRLTWLSTTSASPRCPFCSTVSWSSTLIWTSWRKTLVSTGGFLSKIVMSEMCRLVRLQIDQLDRL